jgi:hypothetical protein
MPTTVNETLPLFEVPRENANVDWLVNLLRQRGWMTRQDILRTLAWPATGSNIRWVRSLVSAAGDEVVKGQKGYNHIANCQVDDILHASNQEIDQGKKMIQYGIALRRRAHQMIR